MEAIKEVMTSAGDLHSTGVIFVPAFNGQTKLGNQEIRKILVDTLPEIGEHAVKRHPAAARAAQSQGGLLPPPSGRRRLHRRDVQQPGRRRDGRLLPHVLRRDERPRGVHLRRSVCPSRPPGLAAIRVLPGQDDRQFVDGFRGLKWIGYQDYCSFECGVNGDPEEEIPKSMAFLRDQWAKA